jgi:hypothetical protein
MRYATAAAACLLVVIAGIGAVSAVHGHGDHVDVAGVDPGGSTTTTTTPASTTSTSTTSTTSAGPPAQCCTSPTATPTLPEAQAGDFEGSISLPSTTLTATEPMPVTLTLHNISDRAVWVQGTRPIGVYLGFYSATGMTGSAALFAPGQTRTYMSTITADPALIGSERLSAAFLQGIPMDFGTVVSTELAAIPPVDVTVVPPGWEPGQALDPSQGTWNIELTSDADHVAPGESFVAHAKITNAGDQPQQTAAYGALALGCGVDEGGDHEGPAVGAQTLMPGEATTFDVTLSVPSDIAGAGTYFCSGGIQFPSYDGSMRGDFSGGSMVRPHLGIVSNTLALPFVDEPGSSTTTTP